MKNIFLILLCTFTANLLMAQTNIGFKAGYTYSTARVYEKNTKQQAGYVSGYSFGIMFKAPFEGILHFSPYINYNRRGYTYLSATGNTKNENIIHYVDIAPGVSFDFPVNKKSAFIIGFSPVLGIAISGKEKNSYSNDSVATKKMVFDFSNYGLADVALSSSIGFKFNKFLIETSFLYGEVNIENNDLNKRKINNRMFNFSIGYYFK